MVTPTEVYREEQIKDLVSKAKETVAIAKKAIEKLKRQPAANLEKSAR